MRVAATPWHPEPRRLVTPASGRHTATYHPMAAPRRRIPALYMYVAAGQGSVRVRDAGYSDSVSTSTATVAR